ncbi:MAG: YchF/TatD family DNA exonuclease [Terrimonas sp.]|nr:YchF/TatD family DNA exonuclease [Terrimonas sp.]
MIDTHCHIYLEDFDNDREAMVLKSVNEGVGKFLLPAIDSGTHSSELSVAAGFPGKCFAMMGLHPCSVKENYREELAIARAYFEAENIIAVGETGLDYYWDLSFKAEQEAAFDVQIGWALEKDIPVVIHSRNATDDCIRMIGARQNGRLKGVFHCFSGTAEQARQIVDMGFFLGIGGVLTFKNAGLDAAIRDIPVEHMVLETDAPYLAPVPYRGKRNESSYLPLIAAKLAEVKSISSEAVAVQTTNNAIKLFAL